MYLHQTLLSTDIVTLRSQVWIEELPADCIKMQVLSSLDASAEYESSNELTNQPVYEHYKLNNQ